MYRQIDVQLDTPLVNPQPDGIEQSLNESLFALDYSPKTPRAVPRDRTSSIVTPTRRRPSSPLCPLDENPSGPRDSYCFPPLGHAPLMPSATLANPSPSSGPATAAQHRMSVSGRPRRPSPLLHEIQPPSRRLSAHQMLLLTPFGGSVPPGALSGGSGMSRGSSSMGSSALPTAPARLGSGTERSSGWPRPPSSNAGTSMSAAPSSMGMGREPNRLAVRSRRSLASTSAHGMTPSPLASAPLTTIFSSDTGSSEGDSSQGSRERGRRITTFISREEVGSSTGVTSQPQLPAGAQRPRLLPATVAMTRSNSLPVLTLRELAAMKEKDGELGIQRGGNWAWVSRDDEEDDDFETEVTPNTSMPDEPALQPMSRRPFTQFQDPFAPRTSVDTSHAATVLETIIPIPSTSSEYHYFPTAEVRRMSEAPSTNTSPASKVKVSETRRPSAPALRGSFTSVTPRGSIAGPSHVAGPSRQTPKAGEVSPGGTPLEPLPSRPKITRYKTSPARFTGLGLNIVVRPTTGAPLNGPGPISAGPSSTVSSGDREGRMPSAHSSAPRSRESSGSFALGHWAPVDFVDPLSAATDVSTGSSSRQSINISPTTRRSRGTSSGSVSVAGRSSRRSSGRVSVVSATSAISAISARSAPPMIVPGYTIEHVASRSHISSFNTSPTFKGRSRFESVDSAFPLIPGGSGGRLSVPHIGAGEGYRNLDSAATDDFGPVNAEHRRSSLGMGTFAKLRRAMSPWFKEGVAQELGAHGAHGLHLPQVDAEKTQGRHWSERRGSWAESWQRAR